jgi:hypothetical protein
MIPYKIFLLEQNEKIAKFYSEIRELVLKYPHIGTVNTSFGISGKSFIKNAKKENLFNHFIPYINRYLKIPITSIDSIYFKKSVLIITSVDKRIVIKSSGHINIKDLQNETVKSIVKDLLDKGNYFTGIDLIEMKLSEDFPQNFEKYLKKYFKQSITNIEYVEIDEFNLSIKFKKQDIIKVKYD